MNWNGTKSRWITVLMLLALPGVTRATVLTNEWTFEEPDGQSAPQVLDSVGSDNGTFVNMSDANRSTDVPPLIGSTRSLSFAGGASDETVTLATQISLPSTGVGADWSVAVWYKGTDPGTNIVAGTNFGSVLLGRDNGDIFANLVIYNGKFAYDHWNGGWQQLTSTITVNNDQWHFLTLVHHANETADIYVDGVLEVTGDATDGEGNAFPYRIDGFMDEFSGHYTQGLLDDAQIYSGTLTESEVGALMAPEPASLSLLAVGGLLLMRRRNRCQGSRASEMK